MPCAGFAMILSALPLGVTEPFVVIGREVATKAGYIIIYILRLVLFLSVVLVILCFYIQLRYNYTADTLTAF